MNFLIYLFFLGHMLFPNPVTNDSNTVNIKIELTKLSEIKELVALGIEVSGYIVEDRYWITNLSTQEITRLKRTRFNYEVIKNQKTAKLSEQVSFLFGKIKMSFDNCGNQLTLSYNQSKRLSFMSIQVFDLSGKRYGRRLGYNIPPSNYDCTLNASNWPDEIYLVQLETGKKEKIQTIIRKEFLTKKV